MDTQVGNPYTYHSVMYIVCKRCAELIIKNKLEYRCHIDNVISNQESWEPELNIYLYNMLDSGLTSTKTLKI